MTGASLDWKLARRRLQDAEQSLEDALAGNPARAAAVYRERAIRLARPLETGTPAAAAIPVLIFRLAQELFALELTDLAEVLPLGNCTPIPGGPPRFAGVINVRGRLIPVLDLAHFLEIPAAEASPASFVLMTRNENRGLGLKVDRVERAGEIWTDQLSPAPGACCRGIAPGPITLLNMNAILSAVFPGHEEKSRTQ